ncbi:uncharacterized protein LOC142327911 isoform X2 [Lycorma delicatula]|uniref:uncharacterized protein LOC142327911 isoform X2 n=1 Tax=Lycorma delicatula TaxID=130591 RepID=UPI003F50D62D
MKIKNLSLLILVILLDLLEAGLFKYDLNLELKIASSDNNLPATCTSVVTRSNSKLSLLSDLFFKPSSNLQDENNEAVLLLQEQDNVLDKSKYFLQTF